jgi:hypothetical protein
MQDVQYAGTPVTIVGAIHELTAQTLLTLPFLILPLPISRPAAARRENEFLNEPCGAGTPARESIGAWSASKLQIFRRRNLTETLDDIATNHIL